MFQCCYNFRMKIVKVENRDVYITLDFPLEQVKQLITFCEKSLPVFSKVYQGDEELAEFVKEGFVDVLKSLVRTIENGP